MVFKKVVSRKKKVIRRPRRVYRIKRPALPRAPADMQLSYPGAGEGIGSALGGLIGTRFGQTGLGASLGGMAGGAIQKVIKSITGFGDYNVHQNSLLSTASIDPPPVVNSMGSTIVRHREYIGDVTASTVFTISSYAINPGISTTFPWLSQIASAYEQYSFRGLVFEFKSTSSDAVLSTATNSALGTVVMATNYNAGSVNFPDKRSMDNYEYANSGKPSCSLMHPVECKHGENVLDHLYVRQGAVPNNQDIRMYDLGNFQFAVIGQQASAGDIGELWATYEIEFMKPHYIEDSTIFLIGDHWQLNTITGAQPLGNTSYTLGAGSNLGGFQSGAVHNVYNFPTYLSNGTYFVSWSCFGSPTASTAPVITANNCTLLKLWQADTVSTIQITAGETVTLLSLNFLVSLAPGLNSITFGVAGTVPTWTAGDLFVLQVNPSFTT